MGHYAGGFGRPLFVGGSERAFKLAEQILATCVARFLFSNNLNGSTE